MKGGNMTTAEDLTDRLPLLILSDEARSDSAAQRTSEPRQVVICGGVIYECPSREQLMSADLMYCD